MPGVAQETKRRISGDASSQSLRLRARLRTGVKIRAGQHNNRLIHSLQPLQKVGKELRKIRRGVSLGIPPLQFKQHGPQAPGKGRLLLGIHIKYRKSENRRG